LDGCSQGEGLGRLSSWGEVCSYYSGGPERVKNFFEKPFLSLMGMNLNNRLLVERDIHQRGVLEIVKVVDREMKRKKKGAV
jgi:hypothetical protein